MKSEECRVATREPRVVQTPKKKERNKTMKYVCKICGYVYDPAEHDGVQFADLPDDWTCPLCGVGKSEFQPE